METVDLFSGFGDRMAASGRVPLLLLLLAFMITFFLTRLYTRLARIKGWGSGSIGGGIHLHHMVIGILMILISGLLEIALRPGGYGQDLLAIAFGVGAALTLDEFALWLYLRDVYWSEEGRSSIDASVVGVLLASLLLVGTSPFGLDGAREASAVVFGMIAFNTLVALVAFLKGKLVFGLLGVFVPVVAIVAAVRLARPRSLWAKWFYSGDGHKLARAHARFDAGDTRLQRLRKRFDDFVGGTPSWPMRAPLEVVDGCLVADARSDRDAPLRRPAAGAATLEA
jgi:hypothetical protein